MPSKHAGQQFTMRFDGDQKALLESLAKKHGGKKQAVLAGLKALEGKAALSREELLAQLRLRLR